VTFKHLKKIVSLEATTEQQSRVTETLHNKFERYIAKSNPYIVMVSTQLKECLITAFDGEAIALSKFVATLF
jgi:hypothetical protein